MVFGNERWTLDPVRGQYYFHQFSLRNATPALHEGSFEELPGTSPSLYGYWLRHPEGDRLVVQHFKATAEAAVSVPLPQGWAGESGLWDELSGQEVGAVTAGVWERHRSSAHRLGAAARALRGLQRATVLRSASRRPC